MVQHMSDTGTSKRLGARLSTLWHMVSPFVYAVAVALLVRAFVAEPWQVPTGSMLNTIQLNDVIFAEKLSYMVGEPKQGDIVVFQSPVAADTTLVKRVIATGGQSIDLVDGTVYVDGQPLDEPYTSGQPTMPFDHQLEGIGPIQYPYTVPEGSVWVMGDNRTNSRDSRYYGPVGLDRLKGRAVLVSWPLDHIGFL